MHVNVLLLSFFPPAQLRDGTRFDWAAAEVGAVEQITGLICCVYRFEQLTLPGACHRGAACVVVTAQALYAQNPGG